MFARQQGRTVVGPSLTSRNALTPSTAIRTRTPSSLSAMRPSAVLFVLLLSVASMRAALALGIDLCAVGRACRSDAECPAADPSDVSRAWACLDTRRAHVERISSGDRK